MEDHAHQDKGHTHQDQGHAHADKGHVHEIENKETFDLLRPGGTWGDGDGGPHFGENFDMDGKAVGHANIQVKVAIRATL